MKVSLIEKVFYEPGVILTFDQAKEKALLFLDYIKMTDEDLVDYWFGLADNWDLNIWIDVDDDTYTDENEEDFMSLTLYKVENGHTTQEYIPIISGKGVRQLEV